MCCIYKGQEFRGTEMGERIENAYKTPSLRESYRCVEKGFDHSSRFHS